jgi:hypothetical protein
MRSASKFTPSALEIGFSASAGSISALGKARRGVIVATHGITHAVMHRAVARGDCVVARTQLRLRISTRVRARRCAADMRPPLIVGGIENARMRRRSKFSISHAESARTHD